MSRSYSSLLLISVTSLIASFSVYADTVAATVVDVNGQPMIVTAVPAPKEVVTVPAGFVNCFVVPAGWNYNNVWVAEHKVCQYTPTTGGAVQGDAWVDGYWACTKSVPGQEPTKANCTAWDWRSGHWVKTLEVY